jgi:hypothetical protein
MSRKSAFWIAFLSAFLSSGLALRVAFSLGLAEQIGEFAPGTDFAITQSKWAGVAALAALVSAIAQIIEKASK